MLPFSRYVVKTVIHNKAGTELFTLYDKECCVLIDDCISNLLRKVSHGFHVHTKRDVEYSGIFIYSIDKFNVLVEGNIRSPHILNEVLEERPIDVTRLKLSDPLYSVFGFVSELHLSVLIAEDEIRALAEFYFGRFSDTVASELFYGFIAGYFPALSIHTYNSIVSGSYSAAKEEWDSLALLQENVNEIEIEDPQDIKFLDEVEIKNIFLVYFTDVFSESIDVSTLMENIVFLSDMFLEIFSNVNLSDTVSAVTLQTPQLVAQKGLSTKDLIRGNTYKLTIKGSMIIGGGIVSYTNEFDIKKSRLFLSFGDHTVDAITNENIVAILDKVVGMLSNKFVRVVVRHYSIDFFNVKCPVLKVIEVPTVTTCIKRFSEYFFIVNDSSKSVYVKYRIGRVQNVLSTLYNKLYAIINRGEELSQDQIYRLKVEYGVEYEDILTMIEDVRMKVTSSFRERGVGISLTQAYVNISGLGSVDICDRILFVVNRMLNLAATNRARVQNREGKQRIENEYMMYVKMLDTFMRNKTDVYWCKACQNYGNKIRKPVMMKHLPLGYKLDTVTNTYINDQGHRILRMDDGVFFGCDERKSNPNKYIGFIKTCSLCCFQEDVFLANTNVARRRIRACWDKNIQTNNTKYVYNFSKMIGDISLMIEEMEPYFKGEYLCVLIHSGPLDLQPRIGQIVFNGPVVMNPQMWRSGRAYSLFLYQNPFLHKVVSRVDHTQDAFDSTPIDGFMRSSARLFDAAVPHNVYRFFFDNESQIAKYSYIEGMHTIIFIMISGLIVCIIDKSLLFGEYVGMFGELRYVNKYALPELARSKELQTQMRGFADKYGASAVLIDTAGMVLGLCLGLSMYVVTSPMSTEVFSEITNNSFSLLPRTVNITISSVVRSDVHITDPAELMDTPTLEAYMLAIFKYRLFVFLSQNAVERAKLLDIIKNHQTIHERYPIMHAQICALVDSANITEEVSSMRPHGIEIDNDTSRLLVACAYPFRRSETGICRLQLTAELRDKLIGNLVNELVYPYSSVYVYTSKFVTSSYSPHMINVSEHRNMLALSTAEAKLVEGQLIQEIYPFGSEVPFMCLFRALANVLFWSRTSGEIDMNRRNLGYMSRSQTYLAFYVHQLVGKPSIPEIIEAFESQFGLRVGVNMENEVITSEGDYTLYVNVRNGSIVNISVGFTLSRHEE